MVYIIDQEFSGSFGRGENMFLPQTDELYHRAEIHL